MLVLSREVNQTIVITSPDGTRIKITMVAIRGNKARIGVDAPRSFTVHRSEIQQKVDGDSR